MSRSPFSILKVWGEVGRPGRFSILEGSREVETTIVVLIGVSLDMRNDIVYPVNVINCT
jgi:hypothetical protein